MATMTTKQYINSGIATHDGLLDIRRRLVIDAHGLFDNAAKIYKSSIPQSQSTDGREFTKEWPLFDYCFNEITACQAVCSVIDGLDRYHKSPVMIGVAITIVAELERAIEIINDATTDMMLDINKRIFLFTEVANRVRKTWPTYYIESGLITHDNTLNECRRLVIDAHGLYDNAAKIYKSQSTNGCEFIKIQWPAFDRYFNEITACQAACSIIAGLDRFSNSRVTYMSAVMIRGVLMDTIREIKEFTTKIMMLGSLFTEELVDPVKKARKIEETVEESGSLVQSDHEQPGTVVPRIKARKLKGPSGNNVRILRSRTVVY
jgi:hypothetical protein